MANERAHTIYIFDNGNCMVFDQDGQQISEYQRAMSFWHGAEWDEEGNLTKPNVISDVVKDPELAREAIVDAVRIESAPNLHGPSTTISKPAALRRLKLEVYA